MKCVDCIYWGKEERRDEYQVCYGVWTADKQLVAEEIPFEKAIPKLGPSRPILTKPDFGCILFEPKAVTA